MSFDLSEERCYRCDNCGKGEGEIFSPPDLYLCVRCYNAGFYPEYTDRKVRT